MTYIDYLNQFNQWLESNPLPGNAQLLYFRLLNVFNRAGWPKQVQVDTPRLMLMAGCQKDAAYRARDKLKDAGFITYKKGKKGAPTAYFLSDKTTKSERESERESATENATHIKTKTKTKKKTIFSPLYPPEGGTDATNKTAETNPDQPTNPTTETIETLNHPDSWGFGPELTRAFSDWLQYKREKRQNYKPTGLKALMGQVRKYAEQYGEAAIADLIRDCMASGWTGIIWDRLERQTCKSSKASSQSKAQKAGLDGAWDYV